MLCRDCGFDMEKPKRWGYATLCSACHLLKYPTVSTTPSSTGFIRMNKFDRRDAEHSAYFFDAIYRLGFLGKNDYDRLWRVTRNIILFEIVTRNV